MIVHFLARVGHRFCNGSMEDDKRRLLLNSKGEGWTQADIRSRFKNIEDIGWPFPALAPTLQGHSGRAMLSTQVR
ncbi:unnamed protein product [Pylaiella littoralis]